MDQNIRHTTQQELLIKPCDIMRNNNNGWMDGAAKCVYLFCVCVALAGKLAKVPTDHLKDKVLF